MRVYLDHAATTPCDQRVISSMRPYFKQIFGNPSSPHTLGGQAQAAIEAARVQVAELIGATPPEIYFTGSGTESDNTAIKGVAFSRQKQGQHLITTQIEHPAVLASCRFLEQQGFTVTYLPVDETGLVDTADVAAAITKQTTLISVMHANNEVGTIQPIKAIGAIARKHGVLFHTDAVQTVGTIPVDVKALGVDLLSLSAHKLYGPKGVGVLYVRQGVAITPYLHGGTQENKLRASTENVAGIVGLAAAAKLTVNLLEQESVRLMSLRDKLQNGLLSSIQDVKLNGHSKRRLPGTLNISIAQVEGEGIILHLDAAGIYCSTGSACSSHNLQPSHVLTAMGLSHELAHGSLRFSLGRSNTPDQIERVLTILPGIITKLRAISPLAQPAAAWQNHA